MELTPDIMKNFRPLHRITQPFNERINSIDYSPDGDRLLVGTDDDIVHVFDGFGLEYVICILCIFNYLFISCFIIKLMIFS